MEMWVTFNNMLLNHGSLVITFKMELEDIILYFSKNYLFLFVQTLENNLEL